MDEKSGPLGPTIVIGGIGGGAERRAADRITYEVDAHVRIGDSEVVAKTENVSASGCFLGVPSLLAVGSKVHVRFTLPAGDFEADATIVRIRPTTPEKGPGVGLMFHDVAPECRARLDQFCPPPKPLVVRHSPG